MKLPRLNESKGKELLLAWGQILLGCLIGGAAYPCFLVPNNVSPGGATGVGMLLNHLLSVPVGAASILVNIPIFVFGLRSLGRVFAFRSLSATLIFSLMIDILPLPPVTTDPLLGTLFGGIVLGIGSGLVIRGGATTGGSDMLAGILHHRFSFISFGTFMFSIEALVIIAAGFVFDATKALYALIEIYVCAKVVDMIVLGVGSTKSCFIMSSAWEKVTGRIMHEMGRGATLLRASGAYSGVDRPVVLCVASSREIPRIKSIVREEDASAFMFVTEAYEALGEGFGKLDEG